MNRLTSISVIGLIAVLLGAALSTLPMEETGSFENQSFAALEEGPNPRFYEVAEKLDHGGSFYLYVDLKDALQDLLRQVKEIAEGAPMPPAGVAVFAMVEGVIDTLGLYGIEDFGLSSVDHGDLRRTKSFLRIPPEQKGLFTVWGEEPHPFDMLAYAPPDSEYFATGDLDLAALLDLAKEIAQQIGGPPMVAQLEQAIHDAGEGIGIDIEKVARSLAGEITAVARLNPDKKIGVPAGEGEPNRDLPYPEFAVLITVKDTTLYDALTEALQGFGIETIASEGDSRGFRVEVPEIEGYSVEPKVVQRDGVLVAASHDSYLDLLLETKSTGENLTRSEDYRKMTEGLPEQGNGLAYVGAGVGKTINEFVMLSMSAEEGADANLMSKIYDLLGVTSAQAGVRVNDPNGLWTVSNRTQTEGPPPEVLALAAPFVAVVGAIAIPNFIEARERAMVVKAKTDVRSMSIALESYHLDWNTYPASTELETLFEEGPGGESNWATQRRLTTPIAYLLSLPLDPESPDGEDLYFYFHPEEERDADLSELGIPWILWGRGPDETWNINSKEDLKRAFDPMSDLHYAPTNGIKSSGDAVLLPD